MSEEKEKRGGWLSRLRQGLARTSQRISEGITAIFTKRKLDEAALQELEEVLIAADIGVATAAKLTAQLAKTRFNQEVAVEEVKASLAADIAAIMAPVAQPLVLDPAKKPHVVLVVGVNGSGKTTTIGKLAKLFRDDGK